MNENDEFVSLNEKLYDEFYVEELEERLETDPFMVGGIFDLLPSNSEAYSFSCTILYCNEFTVHQ